MLKRDTKIRQEKLDGLVIYSIFQSKVKGYRDLNVIRVLGMTPSILEEVAICNWDNVVIIRKGFGNTKLSYRLI